MATAGRGPWMNMADVPATRNSRTRGNTILIGHYTKKQAKVGEEENRQSRRSR